MSRRLSNRIGEEGGITLSSTNEYDELGVSAFTVVEDTTEGYIETEIALITEATIGDYFIENNIITLKPDAVEDIIEITAENRENHFHNSLNF